MFVCAPGEETKKECWLFLPSVVHVELAKHLACLYADSTLKGQACAVLLYKHTVLKG